VIGGMIGVAAVGALSCEGLMVHCVGISGFRWFSWFVVCGARGPFGVDMSLAPKMIILFRSAHDVGYHKPSGGFSLSRPSEIKVAKRGWSAYIRKKPTQDSATQGRQPRILTSFSSQEKFRPRT